LGGTLVFDPTPNPIPQDDLIVDLNADTMFTTGGVLATEGQVIEMWGNSVVGNSVAGASQSDNTRRPVLQIVSGKKEIKFDGTNDFLDFGTPVELDIQTTNDY